jgi:hypothetical protein
LVTRSDGLASLTEWRSGTLIESRTGKYAVVGLLATLALALGTSRPRKARVVYSIAAVCAAAAVGVAVRAKPAPPDPRIPPLGDPAVFITAVPDHVDALRRWCGDRAVAMPPRSHADWDEWLWTHRETLGSDWPATAPLLVATYGELLRQASPGLSWSVRDQEPVVSRRGRAWLGRRLFVEVHDAVFADE